MAGERERGVYMISVAAELAGMHPQTLRIYESRGLIQPKRSPKNTRLYSDEDVQRLRRIQQLTSELGMNLAGVERVFELEQEVARMRRRLNNIERAAERAQEELRQEIARVRQAAKAELVPYEPPGQALAPARAGRGAHPGPPHPLSGFEEPRLLGMLSEHRQSTMRLSTDGHHARPASQLRAAPRTGLRACPGDLPRHRRRAAAGAVRRRVGACRRRRP